MKRNILRIIVSLTPIIPGSTTLMASTITLSGAGTDAVHRVYYEIGDQLGKTLYLDHGWEWGIWWTGSMWEISDFSNALYYHTGDTDIPPKTGWQVGTGDSPAPTFSGDGAFVLMVI